MPWNAVPFSAKDYTGFQSKAGMFLGVEGFQQLYMDRIKDVQTWMWDKIIYIRNSHPCDIRQEWQAVD